MIRIHGRREFFSSKTDGGEEDWQEDHGKDETVQELINKLDAMSMNW